MPHAADEWGSSESMLGFDDQDDFDEHDFDRLDRLDAIDDIDDLDDLDDLDGFEEPDQWVDRKTPDLLPPPDEEADERLQQMLGRLEAAIPEDSPTVWVRVFGAPAEASTGQEQKPNEPGREPEKFEIDRDLPGLMGYVAPADCMAIAIIGVGRAHHYEPTPAAKRNRRAKRPEQKPIDVPPGGMSARALCLMDGSGRMAGRTRLEDGTLIPAPPETGRLVDALRRCFGLPTAPPEFPAGELVARLWLANVLATAEISSEKLGWKQARELHPSAEALRAIGVPLTGTTLDRAREVASMAWSWSRLRLQAMEGDWLPALIDPELAGWMDEGMFSRWVLEGTRTTSELLELITPWVAPSVLTKLASAVRT
ncbi:MAG: hypothetical protein J2O47_02280 [Acidimicrobiaceae bacterium]|nr:hypothetical protein [Acidimicrobiaceae bacterium]